VYSLAPPGRYEAFLGHRQPVYLEGILQFERGSDQWDEPAAILVGPVCEEGANSRASLVNGGENLLALPIVRRFIVFHQFFDGRPVQSSGEPTSTQSREAAAPIAAGTRAWIAHSRGQRRRRQTQRRRSQPTPATSLEAHRMDTAARSSKVLP